MNKYENTGTPFADVTIEMLRLSAANATSVSTAAKRLNSGLSPNVSLPVPKGHPSAGTLGYNSRIRSMMGDSWAGVRLANMSTIVEMFAAESTDVLVNIVPKRSMSLRVNVNLGNY